MRTLKVLMLTATALFLAAPAAAQDDETGPRTMQARDEEVEQRIFEAEERLAQAARQIAELTVERLPQLERYRQRFEFFASDRPRLGVTIGDGEKGPVEGVAVVGVTPGSAADDAGIRAGDILTSVNGESLSADSSDAATNRLLDFLRGIEDGDTLDLEYLRDGKVGKVEVEPKPVERQVFSFSGNDRGFGFPTAPDVHVAPGLHGGPHEFVFRWTSNGWGDMELVELNEGLGRYFGTDEGLLVVNAPESGSLQLEDGDVIQKIDGRKPSSVRHALRILSSYQAGESLQLEIMRDKKRRTLDVAIPDDRSSMLLPAPQPVVRPVRAPRVPRLDAPVERT